MAEKFKSGDMDINVNTNIDKKNLQKQVDEIDKQLESISLQKIVDNLDLTSLKNKLESLNKQLNPHIGSSRQWRLTNEFGSDETLTRELKNLIASLKGWIPKGESGTYSNQQLARIRLSDTEKNVIANLRAYESDTGNKSSLSKQSLEIAGKYNVEYEKLAKQQTEQIKKLQQQRQEIQAQIDALEEYEKSVSEAAKTLESSKQDSTFIKALKQESSQKVKEIKEKLAKAGTELTDNLLAQIEEAVMADLNNKYQNRKDLVTVPGRKSKALNYRQGTGIDSNKGVITTRNFDSLVLNGAFIPGSYTNEEGRFFNQTVAIHDTRLRNPGNIGKVGNLDNASLSAIANKYEELMDTGTKEALEFADTIEQIIIEAFNNTKEDNLKRMFINNLMGLNAEGNEFVDENSIIGNFRKQGGLYDLLRQSDALKQYTTNAQVGMRPFDYGSKGSTYGEGIYDSPEAQESRNEAQALKDEIIAMTKAMDQAKIANEGLNEALKALQGEEFQQFIEQDLEAAKEIVAGYMQEVAEELTGKNIINGKGTSLEPYLSLNAPAFSGDEGDSRESVMDRYDSDTSADLGIDENDASEIQDTIQQIDYLGEDAKALRERFLDLIGALKLDVKTGLGIDPEQAPKMEEVLNKFEQYISSDNLSDSQITSNVFGKTLLRAFEEADKVPEKIGSLVDKLDQFFTTLESGDMTEYESNQEDNRTLSDVEQEYDDKILTKTLTSFLNRSEAEREIDDQTIQKLNEIVSLASKAFESLGTEEGNQAVEELRKITRGYQPIDANMLYNQIGKMLNDATVIDTSIQRRVKALNEASGGENYSVEQERNRLMQDPDIAKRYLQSAEALRRFMNAGGPENIEAAIEAFFNTDDEYIQSLKRRYDSLTDKVTYVSKITDESGKEAEEAITLTGQELVQRGLLGRLDTSGIFENLSRFTGRKFYSKEGIVGEHPEEIDEANLSPALKTGLLYQAGYTGAAYGGKNIQENLQKAREKLEATQKQLEEAIKQQDTVAQQLLQAEIEVTEQDIKTLEAAQEKRIYSSNSQKSTQEQANSKKETQLTEAELAAKEEQRLQNLKKLSETGLEAGATYITTDGTKGKIIEKVKQIVSTFDDITGLITEKEVELENTYKVLENGIYSVKQGDSILSTLYDYNVPLKNITSTPKTQTGGGQKPPEPPKPPISGGSSISADGPLNIHGDVINVDSELTNVNTAEANFANPTVNINGGTVTGEITAKTDGSSEKKIEQVVSTIPQTFEQFVKTVKLNDVSALDLTTKEGSTSFYDLEGNWVRGITNFIKLLNGLVGTPEKEAKQQTINRAVSKLGTGESINASMFNFSEAEYNDLVKTINSTSRGNIIHSAIETLAKSGKDTVTLLDSWQDVLKQSTDFQQVYNSEMSMISKYGLGTDFVRLDDGIESLLNALNVAGIGLNELAEIPVGLKLSGNQGDISVGARFDNLISSAFGSGAMDTKTGYISPTAILQLSTVARAVEENAKASEIFQNLLESMQINVDSLKKINELYIANVKDDGTTDIVPVDKIDDNTIYALLAYAERISKGQGTALTKKEKETYMGVPRTWEAISGTSSTAESVNEELMFIDANQGKVIKDYLSYLKQINDVQLKIVNAQNDMETADENSKQNIQELLDSYNKQLETLKTNQPQLESFVGSEGLQYRLGQNLLDSDHADYLKKKLDEVNNAFESKSIESINKIKVNLEKLTSKDTPINTGLFGEDFDIIVQKIKDGYTEIDRTQESLTAKVKAYEASLRSEVSALKDIATHSTKIQSINEQIDKLQADNSTENSELLNDLNKRLKKEQELLKVAEQRRDVAIQERQGTGLDEDIASGKVDAKTKQRIANTYSTQRQNLVNAVNQGTAKAEADQSVQNYVQANKLIKEYINNLKLQYKTQQEIQKLSIKMENQSGNELAASEAYKAALESRVDSLQEQLPYYDQQSKKLGNIKLEEEQIVSLEKQKNNLAKQQQIAQEKINATVKDQRNILEEIVGGFKQAFRNMTDASIAYEIIGMFRQGVAELLQTIREMDSALVDLQIASGGTREEMHDMMMDLNSLATEVGKTTTEVAQGANDWLRAGYEGQEAADLTRASMQLSTLGMIDSADATSYLISVLKGWKLEAEEVSNVVDKLVSVDMAAAL